MIKNRRKSDQLKKRKPPWILGVSVFVLLTILVLLQSSNLWKGIAVESASDILLSFVLSSLNFVAFLILAFIFGRSLVKLFQERRALRIGSKIKTRLLLYFFAIILLPLIVMPVFSYLYMNRAMDRWFTQTPQEVIRRAGELQRQTAEDQKRKFRQSTDMLAEAFDEREIEKADLQRIIDSGLFSRIEVLNSDFRTIVMAQNRLSDEQAEELNELVALVHQRQLDASSLTDGKRFDVAVSEMSNGRKLVTFSDNDAIQNLSQIVDESLVEFEQQKTLQLAVRRNGLLILAFVSFLLIFAASWMARYAAKGLTRPILALAEGADQITKGNLGYQIDVFADDEIDLLVEAFNEMSRKLDENAKELKDRRRYIETVLESLSTGVISFDDSEKVTTINKAAKEMFKLENEDLLGFALKQLVNRENENVLRRLIARAKRIGNAAEQATLIREYKDGSLEKGEELPVALTASALPNSNGVVLVIEDLSELIAAQRASAWREVARRMAHEIKNPLTPIQLSAERIAKRFRLPAGENGTQSNGGKEPGTLPPNDGLSADEQSKNLRIIKDGTDTILREVLSLKMMVNEFSRFARLPNVKLEIGNINDVIRKTTQLYSDRVPDIEIEFRLDADLPETLIDDEQLKRVFVNLIDNAVESFEDSQERKIIKIRTRFDSVRDLNVIEVSDNGIGIKPGDFQKLFLPYFSTKGRGTGLGLAIVQRIITEHGGKIRGAFNPPTGAKFIIEIPISN